MKLLIFGDVYGRIGRNAIIKELPSLIKKYSPDFIVVNVDNLSSGRGPIEKHLHDLENAGVDIMMGGDHIFDNFDKVKGYLEKNDSKLLRFANFYGEDMPGTGSRIIEKNGKKLLLIHLQGEVFMQHKVNNPFLVAKNIIEKNKKVKLDGIIIDFHKEATSEIAGLANFLDGEVSLVYGTHTHVQTNDEIILPNGTGVISDIGMCGSLYSIIGADFNSVKDRFLRGIGKGKIEQSLDKTYVVSGIYVEIDEFKSKLIEKIRIIKN